MSSVPIIPNANYNLLELFAGTKSVSKAIGNGFTEVISVDIEPTFQPTITADILTWDYTIYPTGYFHTIWASPPCQDFSCLNYARPEKHLNTANAEAMVKRAIEIINYFNPERFFIENPQSGTLKDKEFMLGIPFIDMDYCRFGFPYRKRTRFWTCSVGTDKLCLGKGVCPAMDGSRHKNAIGNSTYDEFWLIPGKRLEQRYAIPPGLIRELFALPY
jgi:hypothetical protein